jgi:hypothetical protein
VVGTEVDVGAAALPVAVMTVGTWPLISANVPQMRLVGGAPPLGHVGPEADGRGGRTDVWRPVGTGVAVTHFRGADVPRGAANAWAALRHLREAELRLEEQARTHRLKACLSGLCRRSPPAGDRWHIRQPVPAARFTAVLREVPAQTQDEPAGTGGGTGTQRKDRCSGVRRPRGMVAGNRGPVWPLEVPLRDAVAHRCDPSASLPRPAPSRPERAWPFTYRHAHRPALPDPAPLVHLYRSRAARCARPFGDP